MMMIKHTHTHKKRHHWLRPPWGGTNQTRSGLWPMRGASPGPPSESRGSQGSLSWFGFGVERVPGSCRGYMGCTHQFNPSHETTSPNQSVGSRFDDVPPSKTQSTSHTCDNSTYNTASPGSMFHRSIQCVLALLTTQLPKVPMWIPSGGYSPLQKPAPSSKVQAFLNPHYLYKPYLNPHKEYFGLATTHFAVYVEGRCTTQCS